jgi:sortase A
MKKVSKPLRLVEIVLWVLGLSLLGAAFGETRERWNYQAQQERALFARGPAVSSASEASAAPAPLPVPETKAAPVEAEETPTPSVVRRPTAKPRPAAADPSAMGRIEIPRLGVSAIVKVGSDEGTLSRAVGLIPESARPGQMGNVVLAGHRDTFFRPLRNIKVKDRIRVRVPPTTYEYEVESVMVVAPEDTNVLRSKGKEELTLVTCYPFRFVGPSPDRFIVSAVRVN